MQTQDQSIVPQFVKHRQEKAARQARINQLQAEIVKIEREQRNPAADVIEQIAATSDAIAASIKDKAANFASNLNLRHFGGQSIQIDVASEEAIAYFFKNQLISSVPELAAKIVTKNGIGLAPFTPPQSEAVAQERLAALRKEIAELVDLLESER